jgi:hypothetical protein
MSYSTNDLSSLFGSALQALTASKDQINEKDSYNGDHGDNVVSTLGLITQALQSQGARPPAEALQAAANTLQTQGRGSSSRYYAQGLEQTAAQFQGQSSLSEGDVLSLLQGLLSAVPAQGGPPPGSGPAAPTPSVFDLLTGLARPAAETPAPAPEAPAGGGDLLGGLLGMVTGQPAPRENPPGLDMGDLLNAGQAFLQARQSGADNTTALARAAMSGLLGANAMQTSSPRAAAGGVLAQSVLQALLGRK